MTCIYITYEQNEKLEDFILGKFKGREDDISVVEHYPFSMTELTKIVISSRTKGLYVVFNLFYDGISKTVKVVAYDTHFKLPVNIEFSGKKEYKAYYQQAIIPEHLVKAMTTFVCNVCTYFPFIKEFLNGASFVKKDKIKKILKQTKQELKGNAYKILCLSSDAVDNAKRAMQEELCRKRYHGVRGHWRKLPNKTVWVKAHYRGDKTLGIIHKDYKVSL